MVRVILDLADDVDVKMLMESLEPFLGNIKHLLKDVKVEEGR